MPRGRCRHLELCASASPPHSLVSVRAPRAQPLPCWVSAFGFLNSELVTEVCAELSPHRARPWQLYLLSGCQETPCSASSAQRSSPGKRCLCLPLPGAAGELSASLRGQAGSRQGGGRTDIAEAGQTSPREDRCSVGTCGKAGWLFQHKGWKAAASPALSSSAAVLGARQGRCAERLLGGTKLLLPLCSRGQRASPALLPPAWGARSPARRGLFVTSLLPAGRAGQRSGSSPSPPKYFTGVFIQPCFAFPAAVSVALSLDLSV